MTDHIFLSRMSRATGVRKKERGSPRELANEPESFARNKIVVCPSWQGAN